MRKDTLVAFCANETVHTRFMLSLLVLLQDRDSRVGNCIWALGGPIIWRLRDQLTEAFMKREYDYLLMIDTDMTWEPRDVTQLFAAMAEDVGVVSGLCVTSGGTAAAAFDPSTFDDASPFDAEGVGAAFMLVSRRVFRDVDPLTAFDDLSGSVGRQIGEDFSFCERVRAAGYRIVVQPSSRPGHLKIQQLSYDGSEPGGFKVEQLDTYIHAARFVTRGST